MLFQLLFSFSYLVLDCVKCPNRTTGQVCSSPYLLPRSCKTGEIPNLNGTECIPCRAGYYCAAPHLQEKECGTGEWSLVGASQCHECRRGFKCPHKDKIPSKCPLGWYASNKNSISCVQCPAGSYCVNTRDNPKLCVPGKSISTVLI